MSHPCNGGSGHLNCDTSQMYFSPMTPFDRFNQHIQRYSQIIQPLPSQPPRPGRYTRSGRMPIYFDNEMIPLSIGNHILIYATFEVPPTHRVFQSMPEIDFARHDKYTDHQLLPSYQYEYTHLYQPNRKHWYNIQTVKMLHIHIPKDTQLIIMEYIIGGGGEPRSTKRQEALEAFYHARNRFVEQARRYRFIDGFFLSY